MKNFKGIGVAMITPFSEDRSIDFESLKKLTHFLIDNGVDYLVVQGTTGESPVLTEEEKMAVLNTIIETNNGQLPIVYGIGGNDTMRIAEKMADFSIAGVDAFLSVSPYYNKPTQEGIYQHFKTISEHSKLPIILYNVPGRTASNILPETTLRLAKDFENIIAVKEASGDMEQIMTLIQHKPDGFLVISGDDAIAMPIMAVGGDGVISVIGNGLPKLFSDMTTAALANDMIKSRAFHYKALPLVKHLFSEGNPAGIKVVLSHYKVCKDYLRLPLINVSSSTKQSIINFLNKL